MKKVAKKAKLPQSAKNDKNEITKNRFVTEASSVTLWTFFTKFAHFYASFFSRIFVTF